MTTVRTKYEVEVLSHRQLWKAARAMRDHSDAELVGSLDFDLPAMLLAYLTVEAYCNFVIHVLDPGTFARERKTFAGSLDKIEWVAARGQVTLDWESRPLSTVRELGYLRNRIVHAKPDVFSGENMHDDEERPFMEPGELEKLVSSANRARAFEDVEQFCESLHVGVLANVPRAKYEQKLRLEPFALKGTTQRQTSATMLDQQRDGA